jgi:hypothetical protein
MFLPTACFFLFFLLEQKETKIQGERPTSIFRAQGCAGNGVKTWSHSDSSLKSSLNFSLTLSPALFRQRQPHYYQGIRDVP